VSRCGQGDDAIQSVNPPRGCFGDVLNGEVALLIEVPSKTPSCVLMQSPPSLIAWKAALVDTRRGGNPKYIYWRVFAEPELAQ
jgi:hypothetical protein